MGPSSYRPNMEVLHSNKALFGSNQKLIFSRRHFLILLKFCREHRKIQTVGALLRSIQTVVSQIPSHAHHHIAPSRVAAPSCLNPFIPCPSPGKLLERFLTSQLLGCQSLMLPIKGMPRAGAVLAAALILQMFPRHLNLKYAIGHLYYLMVLDVAYAKGFFLRGPLGVLAGLWEVGICQLLGSFLVVTFSMQNAWNKQHLRHEKMILHVPYASDQRRKTAPNREAVQDQGLVFRGLDHLVRMDRQGLGAVCRWEIALKALCMCHRAILCFCLTGIA